MTRTRRLLIGLALVAVALLGYAVAQGVLLSPASAPRAAGAPPRLGSSSAAGHSPHSIASTGAPSAASTRGGFAHSERGAVAAAASYLRLLDEGSVAAGTLARLRAMTSPPLTAQALAAEAASAALARRISFTGRAFFGGWRLGWRLDSYTSSTARAAVWTMGMVESAGEVVAPDWSTTVCTLRWSRGVWKVFAAQTSSGPTPPSDGTDRAAVLSFVRSASTFHSFADAP